MLWWGQLWPEMKLNLGPCRGQLEQMQTTVELRAGVDHVEIVSGRTILMVSDVLSIMIGRGSDENKCKCSLHCVPTSESEVMKCAALRKASKAILHEV